MHTLVVNIESLTINATSDITAAHTADQVMFAESSSRKMDNIHYNKNLDYSVLEIQTINNADLHVESTATGNLDHQTYVLQAETCVPQDNKNLENNDVVSIHKKLSEMKKIKKNISSSSLGINHHNVCCKVSVTFAICCVIGCCSLPIIFYYVNLTGDIVTDPEYSHEKNISTVRVYTL